MVIQSLVFAVLAVLILLVLLRIVEWQVSKVFGVSQNTSTGLYQGGETLIARDRGYKIENYNLSVFFLILHVVGFFTATLYILPQRGYDLFNWMTAAFGLVIIYTVVLVRQGAR